MTSLWITLPATLLLALTLLVLVVRAALRGEYDDWEGPAARMLFDDDSNPELEARSDPTQRTWPDTHPTRKPERPQACGKWGG